LTTPKQERNFLALINGTDLFFIGLGVISLGILIYSLVAMHREKHTPKTVSLKSESPPK